MNITNPQKGSPLILVVDDDKFMRIQLYRAMEQAGYQVVEAGDGEQALAVYSHLHPDIVLLDALMPVMDGFTCCTQLQTLPGGKRTPVLMITAFEDQESVDRAFEAGATDYITKPIHWAVLRQRVRRLLMSSRATEELQQQTARSQASEEQLRLVLNAAHIGTWDWDITSGKVAYSVTIEVKLGLAPNSFDGTYESFLKRVHPQEQELVAQAVRCAVELGADYDIEFRTIWPDGTIHWVMSKGQVYYDKTGKAARMTGIDMDITKRKRAEEALRASEAKMRLITTQMPTTLWTTDADLRMNSFLGAGLVQLALEPSQYLDKTLYEVFDTDDPSFPPIAAHFRSLKGESARYELNFEQQEFDVRVEPLREAQNQIVGCIGVGLDITERKRAERHIRFQANVLSQVNDAVIAVDNEQRITYWNNGSQRLYNVTSDEVLGRALDVAYQYRWLRAEDEKAANDSLTATGAWHGENIHIKKSGEEVFVESSVSVLKDKSGANIGLLAVIRNITERKQASQKMQEQAALLDIATDAILVRDLENKIVFWNKGAERLYGWTVELALGKDVYKLLYKASEPKLKEAHKTVAECSSWQGELHQVTKSGQEIVIESRWTPMLDEQGQLKSVLVVNTDITENKQLEAQFLRAQRLESLGTLASGIAHDLNNILTPILATAQLLPLKLPYANQQSQHLLQMLEINAKRGAAVVKQVLSFARGVESQRQNFQLRHLITEIQHVVKATFPKSIELDTDIAPDLWLISGDITQLHQVLMNLVVNARDAMPSSGTLKLCAENLFIDQNYARMHLDAQVGPYIVINVADTGTGMPTEILERIFEPFFTTKPVGSGTGLGLSTVISIIKSHGGFVNVESSVGQGTQFKVYLPAVAGTETLAASDLELPTGHGELIFVVDDELAIREITKITLETHSYKVLTVSDGFEAIALYAQYQHEISAVLMDIIMPSIDGPTAIRILQKINPHVLIIAVSGLASNQKIAEAAGSGVKAFLSKPYTAMELLTTINAVLIAP